jgi:membrane-bound ClpP family serine protease
MTWFTSERERRLWFWVVGVIVAIFSTLVWGGKLGAFLNDGDLSTILFAVGFLLVLITIVTQGLTIQPRGIEVFITLGIVAVVLFLFSRLWSSIERSHLLEFGVLSVFIYEALVERWRGQRSVAAAALASILTTSVIGVMDEGLQVFLPQRVFDPQDILFNTLAAAGAVSASLALRWVRQWRRRVLKEH